MAPTGNVFIGLLIRPEHTRKGLRRHIVEYRYWQASLAGLRTHSATSRHNPAYLRSHQAVADFKVVAELPNYYLMIEAQRARRDRPVLEL